MIVSVMVSCVGLEAVQAAQPWRTIRDVVVHRAAAVI